MDNPRKVTEGYLANELLVKVAHYIAQENGSTSRQKVKNIVNFGLVNKQYHEVSLLAGLWYDIFSRKNVIKIQQRHWKQKGIVSEGEISFLNKEEDFIYKVSRSCLDPRGVIGKEFYKILITQPWIDSILAEPVLLNAIEVSRKHSLYQLINTVRGKSALEASVWPTDFSASYIKLAGDGMQESTMYTLALFFKACCIFNEEFSTLEKLYSKKIEHEDVYKTHKSAIDQWGAYVVKNIMPLYVSGVQSAGLLTKMEKTARAYNLGYDIIIFPHSLIGYLTKDTVLKENCDEFGQDALIKACRYCNYTEVKKLLISKKFSSNTIVTKEDILGFNALYIAILDHSNDILDLLLNKVADIFTKDLLFRDELLHFAIQCNNTHAVEKLLAFYDTIAALDGYLFWRKPNKDSLEHAFNVALAGHTRESVMVKLFFAKSKDFQPKAQ